MAEDAFPERKIMDVIEKLAKRHKEHPHAELSAVFEGDLHVDVDSSVGTDIAPAVTLTGAGQVDGQITIGRQVGREGRAKYTIRAVFGPRKESV